MMTNTTDLSSSDNEDVSDQFDDSDEENEESDEESIGRFEMPGQNASPEEVQKVCIS